MLLLCVSLVAYVPGGLLLCLSGVLGLHQAWLVCTLIGQTRVKLLITQDQIKNKKLFSVRNNCVDCLEGIHISFTLYNVIFRWNKIRLNFYQVLQKYTKYRTFLLAYLDHKYNLLATSLLSDLHNSIKENKFCPAVGTVCFLCVRATLACCRMGGNDA